MRKILVIKQARREIVSLAYKLQIEIIKAGAANAQGSYDRRVLFIKKRIEGFDVARAIAVFGMVLVNFKIVMGAKTVGLYRSTGAHPLCCTCCDRNGYAGHIGNT